MLWFPEQMAAYQARGFLYVPGCFVAEELALLRDELVQLAGSPSPSRVLERHGASLRALQGDHETSPLMGRRVRDARLVDLAMQGWQRASLDEGGFEEG